MASRQQGCGPLHCLQVEFARRRDDEGRPKRVDHRGAAEPVAVDLEGGALAGVKGLVHRVGVQYADRSRQITVAALDERPARFRGRRACGHRQVGHLAAGVDAGVRAAGPVDGHASAEDSGQGFFDNLLDGERVVLALPAGVVCADIGDSQAELHRASAPEPDTLNTAAPARRRSIMNSSTGGSQTAT